MRKSYLTAVNYIIPDYFCIESLEDNNTIEITNYLGDLYYSNNKKNWTKFLTSYNTLELDTNEKIYFRRRWSAYTRTDIGISFNSSKTVNIFGCLSTLINAKDNFIDFYDSSSPNTINKFKLDTIENTSTIGLFWYSDKVLKVVDASEFSINVGCIRANSLFTKMAAWITKSPKYIRTMGSYNNLFKDCTLLTSGPIELPSVRFSGEYMFSGCSALTIPPRMPWEPIQSYVNQEAYSYMFNNCVNLEKLPKLNIKYYLAMSGMFNGCSKIKFSQTQSDEYQYVFKIPYTGTYQGSDPAQAFSMITNTGGSYTGNITVDTVYYTSNEVI